MAKASASETRLEQASASATVAGKSTRANAATGTVDLSLFLLEYLVASRKPVGVTELAKVFESSKATIYRHIQALVKHGFAQQDQETNRYEAGVKLMVLGETLRERFNILTAARKEMSLLREATGLAVSLSTFTNDEVIALELLQGRTVVEFGVKAGTRMDFHATAHGKLALAFGPPHLFDNHVHEPLRAWTPHTIKSTLVLKKDIKAIRKCGWSTAANEVMWGVNALAAPIFDHREAYTGAIAIIGSTQLIQAKPEAGLIDLVANAAHQISRALGSLQPRSTGEKV